MSGLLWKTILFASSVRAVAYFGLPLTRKLYLSIETVKGTETGARVWIS